jgi:hypothetical protein
MAERVQEMEECRRQATARRRLMQVKCLLVPESDHPLRLSYSKGATMLRTGHTSPAPAEVPVFADVNRQWDLDACRWTFWLSDGRPLPPGYYVLLRSGDAKRRLFHGPFKRRDSADTALEGWKSRADTAEARVALWQPARKEES